MSLNYKAFNMNLLEFRSCGEDRTGLIVLILVA